MNIKLRRLIIYLVITLVTIAPLTLFLHILIKPGYIIFTDVTEGLKIDHLYERYAFTYSDDRGESLAEKARIPLFYFVYEIFKLSNLGDEFYIKIKFALLIIVTLLSYFYSLKILLATSIPHKRDKLSFLFAFSLGALYYTTNYWATNRLAHFYLFFSASSVAITFSHFYKFFFIDRDYRIRTLIYLALLLSVFSATPHTTLLIALVIIALLIVFTTTSKKDPKLKKIWGTILFVGTYILFNCYWILPFLISNSKPDAILVHNIIDLLNQYATLPNEILLKGYWWQEPTNYIFYQNTLFKVVFAISSYAVIVTLSFFIYSFRKSKLALAVGILFTIGTFMASKTLSTPLYDFLMFKEPFKNIGWLFREYDKTGLILAFLYAISISLLIYKKFSEKRHRFVTTIIVIVVLTNPLLYFFKTVKDNYTPQVIPTDFVKVNNFLATDLEESNVAWFPGNERTKWLTTRENRYVFTNLISNKPAITTKSDLTYLLEFILSNDHINSINIARALDILGVKYLIIRKDGIENTGLFATSALKNQPAMELVLETPLLNVYKNKEFSGFFKIYTKQIITNKGLNIFKELDTIDTSNTLISFTDTPYTEIPLPTTYEIQNGEFIDLAILPYYDKFIYPAEYLDYAESGKHDRWRKSSLKNLTHAENSFFFNNYGIYVNQLDFDKMVATALDGWEINNKYIPPLKSFPATFSKHLNIKGDNEVLLYTSLPTDFKYYWNIVRSDAFNIQGVHSIHIYIKSRINADLIPHFKITSYDSQEKAIDVKFMYANETGQVNDIIRLPQNAETADLSVWTLSTPGIPYRYTLEKIELSDVSNNVKPLSMTLKTKGYCQGDCFLFVRVLQSRFGGDLNFIVNGGNNSSIYTFDKDLEEHYKWICVGNYKIHQENVEIILESLNGINSVNALVLLNRDEAHAMEKELSYIDEKSKQIPLRSKFPFRNNTSPPDFIKINPARYSIQLDNNIIGDPVLLGFPKSYSRNWILGNKPSILINGFLNGWFLEKGVGTFTLQYIPQRYFYLGGILSTLALTSTLILSAITEIKTRRQKKKYPKDKPC